MGPQSKHCGLLFRGIESPFFLCGLRRFFKNNKSARDNPDFVTEAILDLIKKNLVSEIVSAPEHVNPISVSIQGTGEKRLVMDLSYINVYVWKQKVCYEDWEVALEYFPQGDYMFSFDF